MALPRTRLSMYNDFYFMWIFKYMKLLARRTLLCHKHLGLNSSYSQVLQVKQHSIREQNHQEKLALDSDQPLCIL